MHRPAKFNWKYFLGLQLLAFALLIIVKPWQPNADRIIHWDVSIYYTYLPAAFIYRDIGIEQDWPVDLGKHEISITRPHNGKEVLKMSMGMAYMYAPFFFVGHAAALLLPEVAADGYTMPYQVALAFAGVFWSIVGCYFLFLFLSRFTTKSAASISVALILIGTNLFYYTIWEGAMSHASLFALLSLMLYFGEKYLENQSSKVAAFLGLLVGLIILIRPIILLPIVGLIAFYAYRMQFKLKWLHIPLIAGVALLPWIPQMLYWHYITGDVLYYSYGEEGFFFNDPKIIKGLFSWRKGWLVYTPIMAASLIGFWPLVSKQRQWFWFLAPLFLAYIYIIFSWWCWWYGGSYGMRTMIEFYPFLALPFALLVDEIVNLKVKWRIPLLSLFIALAAYNVFAIWQYKKSLLHWDSMTKEAYEAIFLQTDWPDHYQELLESPDYGAAVKGDR
jgi:hypothetical protein